MSAGAPRVRLRQAVLAAGELEPVELALRSTLALQESFHDPGVGMFGLQNAVFALGDRFLEIVSPVQPDTAAGRYMERHGGDCGYMIMFDLEDLDAARARAQQAGVRTVWQIDLPDISGTHLHPGDMRGAIVSIDSSRPDGYVTRDTAWSFTGRPSFSLTQRSMSNGLSRRPKSLLSPNS